MLKSKAYHMAMMSVVQSSMRAEDKISILKVLIRDEDMALYTEKREAEEAATKLAEELIKESLEDEKLF